MGESPSTYQLADLVAGLTAMMRGRQRDLLQYTITQLRPVSDAITTGALSWHLEREATESRFAAVFLDLLFAKLDAEGFDEPSSALGNRVTRDPHENVTAKEATKDTLTGTASDLITAAWFDLGGIDYMASTFVFSRSQQHRRLWLATYDGVTGSLHWLETATIAKHSSWAYTIETGTRQPSRNQ